MKSERRHELQHNALADWLAQTGKAIEPYQNQILLGITLALVIALGYVYYNRTTSAAAAEAWELVSAGLGSQNVEELSKVVEQYPGTSAAHAAAVAAADIRLARACNQLFNNKALARQDLSKAVDFYRLAREQSHNQSVLERATFGLARAKEAAADAGSIGEAKQLYEELATKWPNSAFVVIAKQRLADLSNPETKRMYDDFAKWEKPVFSGEGGLSNQMPGFDSANIPEEGPVAPVSTKKNATAKPVEKNATDSKPAAEKKAPESKSAAPAKENLAPAKAAEKSTDAKPTK